MKQTVQERAKEMCEAWGMEDNHGYSVKDTFQIGFVQLIMRFELQKNQYLSHRDQIQQRLLLFFQYLETFFTPKR